MQKISQKFFKYCMPAIGLLILSSPSTFAQENTVFSIDEYTTMNANTTAESTLDTEMTSSDSSIASGTSDVGSTESNTTIIDSDFASSAVSVSSSTSTERKEVKLYRQGVLVQTIILDDNQSISSIAEIVTVSSSIASSISSSVLSSESSSVSSIVSSTESAASSTQLRSSAPSRSSLASMVQMLTVGIAIIGGGIVGIIALKKKKYTPLAPIPMVNEQALQNQKHLELEKAIHS